MDIPHRYDDVTADWLTAAVSEMHPAVEIHSCELGPVAGTKQNKVRARVRFNEEGDRSGLTRTLVIKGSFHGENPYNDSDTPDQPLDTGSWLETMTYREVLPDLPANRPACYAAHWDESTNAGFIVLEDLSLRNVRYLDALQTLTYPQAAAFMDSLARMHARYWDSTELQPGGRFGPGSALAERSRALRETVLVSFVKLGAAAREEQVRLGASTLASRDHLLPRMFHDKQRQAEAARRLFEVTDTFSRCVVHGDEHLRNLYLDADGTPGLLDWCARVEGWPVSIGYFVVNTLDPLDRREWEKPLLAHYRDRLAVYGVRPPSEDTVWFGYRCGAVFALLVWANNRGAWQPEVTNSACTVRAAAAVVDLDSFGALGV